MGVYLHTKILAAPMPVHTKCLKIAKMIFNQRVRKQRVRSNLINNYGYNVVNGPATLSSVAQGLARTNDRHTSVFCRRSLAEIDFCCTVCSKLDFAGLGRTSLEINLIK